MKTSEEITPNYRDKDYQKKVFYAELDGIKTQFQRKNGEWCIHASIIDVADSIIRGRPIRIKPEPKAIPLDDFKIGEPIMDGFTIWLAERVEKKGNLNGVLGPWTITWNPEQQLKLKVYRNGEWVSCCKIVEQ